MIRRSSLFLFPFVFLALAQVGALPLSEPPKVVDIKTLEDYLTFLKPIRQVMIFGPTYPFPKGMDLKGMNLEVIAGKDLPPTWVDQARKGGATVRVYLLPGKVAQGSFYLADDRYLVVPTDKGFRVLDSREVALIVKAYLLRAVEVARQSGVVR